MTTYVFPNFKSKKEFKEHIKNGGKVSFKDQSIVCQKNYDNYTGQILDLAGPHYPKSHSWYANVVLENGIVKKVS